MFYNLPLKTTLTILFVILIISAILAISFISLTYVNKHKKQKIKHPNTALSIAIIASFITILSGFWYWDLKQDINNYSVKYYQDYQNLNTNDFTQSIKKTWLAKEPKPNQKGIVIVLYKFKCPDCESVYAPVNRALPHNNKNIYYLSSQSPYGKKLVKEAGITDVPSVVYVTKHDKKHPYYSTSLIYNRELNMNTLRYYLSLVNSNI